MSNNHYVLTVPVEYRDNGITKTTFRRVGVVFENTRKETGEIFFNIKLDFPVGATELVAFPPQANGDISE